MGSYPGLGIGLCQGRYTNRFGNRGSGRAGSGDEGLRGRGDRHWRLPLHSSSGLPPDEDPLLLVQNPRSRSPGDAQGMNQGATAPLFEPRSQQRRSILQRRLRLLGQALPIVPLADRILNSLQCAGQGGSRFPAPGFGDVSRLLYPFSESVKIFCAQRGHRVSGASELFERQTRGGDIAREPSTRQTFHGGEKRGLTIGKLPAPLLRLAHQSCGAFTPPLSQPGVESAEFLGERTGNQGAGNQNTQNGRAGR